MSKQPIPAPSASAVGPCPYIIQVRKPRTGSLPSTIVPSDHPRDAPKKDTLTIQSYYTGKSTACSLSACALRNISVCDIELITLMPRNTGPEVIKLFSCSTQLSMKFFLLINVKRPTIVGILTFMSRKNSLLHLSEPGKS